MEVVVVVLEVTAVVVCVCVGTSSRRSLLTDVQISATAALTLRKRSPPLSNAAAVSASEPPYVFLVSA